MKPQKKHLIFATIIVLLSLSIAFVSFNMSNTEQFENIATNVSMEEAQQITEILNQNNIKWKHDPKDGSISVSIEDTRRIKNDNILEELSK